MDIYAALEEHSVKLERIRSLAQMANDLAWGRITIGEDESEEIHRIGYLMETAIESLMLREKEIDMIMAAVNKGSMEMKSPLA